MSHAGALPAASLAGDIITISAFGREWVLKQAANLEELWDAMGEDGFEDERIPYWTELWPASLVLAQWLYIARTRIRNEICLDLGCGLGLTAMIGQWLGARVIAADYELAALFKARQNVKLNLPVQPLWLAMDWRLPAVASSSIIRLWAGDIIYEKRSIAPVLDLMEYCLHPDGAVWLAEPGRSIFKDFIASAEERGWNLKKVYSQKVSALQNKEPRFTAAVWEVRQ